MKYLKIFESFGDDITVLKNKLAEYQIPVEQWGSGKSKTIHHLNDELKNSECYLEEKNGEIIRYIEFVGIKIYFDNGEDRFFLKEDRQEFNDGRIRRRNIPSSVSEKMQFGEDSSLAAVRGISEELGIEVKTSQIIKRRDLFYDGGSLSYPGLKTKYKGHQYICNLEPEQYDPNGYIEVQKDKKTFFVWIKI